jgi:hypothetical protein
MEEEEYTQKLRASFQVTITVRQGIYAAASFACCYCPRESPLRRENIAKKRRISLCNTNASRSYR